MAADADGRFVVGGVFRRAGCAAVTVAYNRKLVWGGEGLSFASVTAQRRINSRLIRTEAMTKAWPKFVASPCCPALRASHLEPLRAEHVDPTHDRQTSRFLS